MSLKTNVQNIDMQNNKKKSKSTLKCSRVKVNRCKKDSNWTLLHSTTGFYLITWREWLCNQHVSVRYDVALEALVGVRLISKAWDWERTCFFKIIFERSRISLSQILLLCRFYLCYHLIIYRNPWKWSKTVTMLPTRSEMEPGAVSRVVQCTARRKGSASSGYGVTAGESLPLSYRRCRFTIVFFTVCCSIRG